MELLKDTEIATNLFVELWNVFNGMEEDERTGLPKMELYGNRGAEGGGSSDDRVFPLDVSLRILFEALMDADFRKVRVHTGGEAEQLTRRIGATAVTMGQDIYFSAGSFSSQTQEGRTLLAHELEHAKQNSQSRSLRYHEDVAELEHEASIAENLVSDSSDLLCMEDQGLSGFIKQDREKNLKIHLTGGRVFTVKQSQFDEFVTEVKDQLNEQMRQDLIWASGNEKKKALEQFVNWVER